MSMGKLPRVVCACTTVVLLGGCGTVANLELPTQAGGRQPYGGVRQDLALVSERVGDAGSADSAGARIGGGVEALLVTAVDLPLSVVGDTVTLPITVPAYFLQAPSSRSVAAASPASSPVRAQAADSQGQ
jgi:uncharacterized protein YceK